MKSIWLGEEGEAAAMFKQPTEHAVGNPEPTFSDYWRTGNLLGAYQTRQASLNTFRGDDDFYEVDRTPWHKDEDIKAISDTLDDYGYRTILERSRNKKHFIALSNNYLANRHSQEAVARDTLFDQLWKGAGVGIIDPTNIMIGAPVYKGAATIVSRIAANTLAKHMGTGAVAGAVEFGIWDQIYGATSGLEPDPTNAILMGGALGAVLGGFTGILSTDPRAAAAMLPPRFPDDM
jgi:hypothetical protein